jgi:hypothetical protein
MVRFARLIHRRGRVLGGPAVRAAYGGDLKPALVATPGGAAGYRPSGLLDGARRPPRELCAGIGSAASATQQVTVTIPVITRDLFGATREHRRGRADQVL